MAVCNDYLRKDLEKFEAGVCRLINVPLTQNEFDSIVSFAFNVGLGALESSTFRKRMNKEAQACVLQRGVPAG